MFCWKMMLSRIIINSRISSLRLLLHRITITTNNSNSSSLLLSRITIITMLLLLNPLMIITIINSRISKIITVSSRINSRITMFCRR